MKLGSGAKKILQLLIVLLIASFPAVADDLVIDFLGPGFQYVPGKTMAEANGTIEYAGGVNPLVGTNINIGGVVGIQTPNFSGNMFSVVGGQPNTGFGVLNFRTGDYQGTTGGFQSFAGGGLFEIWGAIPQMNLGYRRLLWGSLLGALVDAGGYVKLSVVAGTDTKDPEMLTLFGLDPEAVKFVFSGTIHSFSFKPSALGAFSTVALGSTNISNAVVPEPGSLALIGSAMVFMSLKLRKKLAQKS